MALPGKKDIKEIQQEAPQQPEVVVKSREIVPPPAPEQAPAAPEVAAPPAGERAETAPAPAEFAPSPKPKAPSAPVSVPAPVKDEVTTEIESILSADLTDLFLKMNPAQQEAFREKGEETATKIRQILASARINVHKIVSLITDWLRMIPGVNKFFLEKEAKIKTDKILLSSEDFREEGKL